MYSQTRHPVTSIKQLPVVKGHIFLLLSYKISPDFYLWGYLKDNVYKNNSQTIPELKREITAKIKLVECVLVIDIFRCASNTVGHIWSIFWKGCKTKTAWPLDLKLGGQVVHG